MLVQGLAVGKDVTAELEEVSVAGQRATALALVFTELLGNALEHGGRHVSISMRVDGSDVALAIADDGPGMQAAAEGTGMSIVRALVRRRARRVAHAPGRRRPACGSALSRLMNGGTSLRILIAEDETIIRLDLRELLERSGFEVCAEARDGEEAVELARSSEPDLAVLDVKMPRLDGIEAARRILEERPIPIVMVTAYGEEELVSRAVEAGVYGYLVKPFRENDLLPAIATARARHEELAAVRSEAARPVRGPGCA